MKRIDIVRKAEPPLANKKEVYELIKFYYNEDYSDLYSGINEKWSKDNPTLIKKEELVKEENVLLLKVYNIWRKKG
ncbi:MAG TPA: hypothetical protein DEP72_07855 [Clostridiales bacterium]|nr:hypothetical protein [Clostridiales bacterium]